MTAKHARGEAGEVTGAPWAFAAVIGLGLAARALHLDRLPGVNGDEAWSGVNVFEQLRGQPTFARTPTGNLLNPFYNHALLAASWLAGRPSFAALRSVALAAGVAAVALAYPLLRAPLGRRGALYAAALLAASPQLIAYSRFGWDTCESGLVTLLALAAAMRQLPAHAALALLVALFVHPTNVFLTPVLVAAFHPTLAPAWASLAPARRRRLALAGAVGLALAAVAGAAVLGQFATDVSLPTAGDLALRYGSSRQWAGLVGGYARLLAGVSACEFLAGPVPAPVRLAAAVLTWAALVAAAVAARSPAPASASTAPFGPAARRALVGAVLLSLLALYTLSGDRAMRPATGRYAMFIVAPSLVALAAAADLFASRPGRARLATRLVLGACALTLALCGAFYFRPLLTTGGDAHATFRTGPREPKQRAWEVVSRATPPGSLTVVLASQWWLYLPLRYLAEARPDEVRVELIDGDVAWARPPGAAAPPYARAPDRAFVVAFEGSPALSTFSARPGARAYASFADPRGRAILRVIAVPPGEARPYLTGPVR
jgi:hypothetical protein